MLHFASFINLVGENVFSAANSLIRGLPELSFEFGESYSLCCVTFCFVDLLIGVDVFHLTFFEAGLILRAAGVRFYVRGVLICLQLFNKGY